MSKGMTYLSLGISHQERVEEKLDEIIALLTRLVVKLESHPAPNPEVAGSNPAETE